VLILAGGIITCYNNFVQIVCYVWKGVASLSTSLAFQVARLSSIMVRKKPPLVADNPKDVLKSACPGCKMEVDESTGIRCDLCKSHSHINCMDVAPEKAQLLLRIHRRSSHLKLLCSNYESVFQCSPLSPIDPTVPLEDNVFC
jgi:hypothetical protein